MSNPEQSKAAEPKAVSMAAFLESIPPDTQVSVTELVVTAPSGGSYLNACDISLHCDSTHCHGKQRFEEEGDRVFVPEAEWRFLFVKYVCRNCGETRKQYSLAVRKGVGREGRAQKLGEIPVFGPHVPSRVLSLIGPDGDIFQRGRRSENHGLGIGAFSYYRRVVENQKNRIIGEMKNVAAKLGAPGNVLKLFDDAQQETQFTRAVDTIKDSIPSALLIDGHHNPLKLLHDALSDGLHQQSDEECLEAAKEIRLVLTHLAERMAEVLKSDAELKDAVSKLLNRKRGTGPLSS